MADVDRSLLRVWKFALPGPDASCFMPEGARLLDAAIQHGEIVVWAECDPEAPREPRRLVAVNTGNAPPETGVFLRTVTSLGGIVWHVYDCGPE